VRRDVALLGELPPGLPVAFHYRPTPRHLALDLALQASGRCPLPIAHREASSFDPRKGLGATPAWARIEGDEEGPVGLPGLTLPESEPQEAEELPALDLGAPAVVRAWGEAGLAELDQERLAAAAKVLHGVLEPGPERPVALICGPLDELPERLWLGWALHAGAALVLIPEPASVGWGLFWSRPTMACLEGALLPRVRAVLEREAKPPAMRRRLRRLARVLVWGPLPEGEEEAWSRLGFPTRPFPTRAALE
jgi:hypothetical protein